MKALLLRLTMICTLLTWAEDGEDQEIEITDQQRCTEWAEMDGTESAQMASYMKECLASLGHDTGENEEPVQEQDYEQYQDQE